MEVQNKKNIQAEIKIKLEYENEKMAKSICEATAPENRETPQGVQATSISENNKIFFEVKSENKFKDLISTVEDFFEKVSISQKTLEKIKD
ncbi:MAG: KEOPS complex subunit Pcc1 [Candidatus Thorarchaeota archaeon]